MSDPTRPAYWRSLDELADTPEFRRMVENEFPSELPSFLSPVTRRGFLKVMGASMALLGLTGCRWPSEEIVPFAHRPEGTDPGVPKHFASAMERGGFAVPVLVTSFDGRPIKVDGNPDHPMCLGGSDPAMQASVLELYDPDRSRNPLRRVGGRLKPATFEEFAAWAGERFAALRLAKGRGLAILAEPSSSPTIADLRRRLETSLPEAIWSEHAPFDRENEAKGIEEACGRRLSARPDLDAADVVVCLDDDLFGDHPAALRATRDFARRRKAEDGTMNRLWVAESAYSITGGSADHRLAIRSGRIGLLARALAGAELPGPEGEWAKAAAEDLEAHRGRSLVTVGPGQPPLVHALAYRLNHRLGNAGKTVRYHEAARPAAGLADLVRALKDGAVDCLLILGGNPAWTAPADLGFREALAKAKDAIHLSLFVDETTEICGWHLNAAHWLESWGDATTADGRRSVVQPLIRPLYDGRTAAEILALVLADDLVRGYDLVRRTWGVDAGAEERWRKVLHDGFDGPVLEVAAPAPVEAPPRELSGGDGAFEVVIRPDRKIGDGRYANNAWLQELPDPMTKITWDNAALLAPGDAAALGIEDGDHVRIAVGAASITIPAAVAPGQAKGSVALAAGYGRTRGGKVADGVGVDVYPLRAASAPVAPAATVEKVPGHRKLARTENHHAIDPIAEKAVERRRRHLVREGTLAEYRADPEFAKEMVHTPELVQLWKEPVEYDGLKWGMSIDLSACNGCGACVVACQAENNVPVVGRDEVLMGREMHWLRVDRYYAGTKEEPKIRHQPIPCMQCENAPCEQVCPVAATVHSHEGLNDMVYNRCVGTRYCSNNCPYKVRRFNWFLNHKGKTEIGKMVFNPEVTVRSRGVMEKCNYCVQRISRARIAAKNEGRPVRDGDVVPACAQSCPAEAIVFGDLNDESSRVRRLHGSARDYSLLEELNVRPRTRYLAKLSNPAKE